MHVTLTRVTQNPVDAIEEAASNCYNSQPTGGKIMKSCYRSGHHSVLEFADFTFHIEGVSRALTHQLVRHRMASYAQRSQRYCSEDGFKYITPNTIKGNETAITVYNNLMDQIALSYKLLQELGISNEDARMILPNACETVIEVKMNGRELIHFTNERECTRAQWEIRELAKLMHKTVAEHDEQCAKFAELLGPKCQAYGFCTEHNSCGRYPKFKDIYNEYQELEDIKVFIEQSKLAGFDSPIDVIKAFNEELKYKEQ